MHPTRCLKFCYCQMLDFCQPLDGNENMHQNLSILPTPFICMHRPQLWAALEEKLKGNLAGCRTWSHTVWPEKGRQPSAKKGSLRRSRQGALLALWQPALLFFWSRSTFHATSTDVHHHGGMQFCNAIAVGRFRGKSWQYGMSQLLITSLAF